MLSEDESEKIALAVQRVSDQYGKVIDPKTEAWVGLAGILGACYAPRIMAYNARKRAQARAGNPEQRRPAQPQQAGPTMPPAPEPQPQARPETQEDKKPAKKSSKGGSTNPSEVFGAINFDPGKGTMQ